MTPMKLSWFQHSLTAASAGAFMLAYALIVFLVLVKSTTFESVLFSVIPLHSRQAANERMMVSRSVHGYFFQNQPPSSVVFTNRERAHLADVKGLFTVAEMSAAVSILLASLLLSVVWRAKQGLHDTFKMTGVVGMVLFAAIGISIALFFEQIFYAFHAAVFANDFWLLDPSMHALIRAYPEEYFYLFFVSYAAVLALAFGYTWFLAVRYQRRRSP